MKGLIAQSCRLLGVTRQSYYQYQRVRERKILQEEIIVQLVREIRKKLPKAGGKTMHPLLKDDLKRMDIKLGRDGFFDVLRSNNLLLKRRKRSMDY